MKKLMARGVSRFYHITAAENAEKILTEGLIPKVAPYQPDESICDGTEGQPWIYLGLDIETLRRFWEFRCEEYGITAVPVILTVWVNTTRQDVFIDQACDFDAFKTAIAVKPSAITLLKETHHD